MKRGLIVLIMLALCFSGFAEGAKETATYPSKPVEVTVQWSAGGGADLVFRAFAEVFPKYANGQTMVIKNAAGASGVTGTADFMNTAKADGYQLMHWSNAHVSKLHMSKCPFDTDSFAYIGQICENTHYLLVQSNSKWNTLEEFLADAKAHPETITVGNGGTGGGNHLAALQLEEQTGAKFVHVPFKGGAAALTGLMSGEVQAAICNSPEGYSNVQAGQVRMLISFGADRLKDFPEVKTAKESGLDIELRQWRGFAAPKATPADVVEKFDAIIKQVVADPDFVAKLDKMGVTPVYRNSADFTAFVKSEDARFKSLIISQKLGDRY